MRILTSGLVASAVAGFCVAGCTKTNDVGDDVGGDQVEGDKTTVDGDQVEGDKTTVDGDQVEGDKIVIGGDQVIVQSGCKIGDQQCADNQLQECREVDGILGWAVIKECAPGTCSPGSLQLCPDPPAPGTVPTCENASPWVDGEDVAEGEYRIVNEQLFVCAPSYGDCFEPPLVEGVTWTTLWVFVEHCNPSHQLLCENAISFTEWAGQRSAEDCPADGQPNIEVASGTLFVSTPTNSASVPELYECTDLRGCEIGWPANVARTGDCNISGDLSPKGIVCP